MTPGGVAENHNGRFAPSPTGALHFGSLLAGLASFLQARSHNAQWYVRMEDLDEQRAQPGAADHILRTLERFALHWDGPVLYQSDRHAAHEAALNALRQHTFPCSCTRREAQTGPMGLEGPIYPGTCRNGPSGERPPRSIRLRVPDTTIEFRDRIQGAYAQNLSRDVGDFVLKRLHGHASYQLAVVVDDAYSGVGEVVRGADLLVSTPRQMYLQKLLQLPRPAYFHIPVLLDENGRKLSKQSNAPGLSLNHPERALISALNHLGQAPPRGLEECRCEAILDWAIHHWRSTAIPACVQLSGYS